MWWVCHYFSRHLVLNQSIKVGIKVIILRGHVWAKFHDNPPNGCQDIQNNLYQPHSAKSQATAKVTRALPHGTRVCNEFHGYFSLDQSGGMTTAQLTWLKRRLNQGGLYIYIIVLYSNLFVLISCQTPTPSYFRFYCFMCWRCIKKKKKNSRDPKNTLRPRLVFHSIHVFSN